jgi:phosphate transport system substrate-binding protein
MKLQSSTKYLLGTASVLALSAATFFATGVSANAAATQGLYLGGSTLASESFRQILDCYTGAIVSNGNAAHSDGFTFSAGFVSTAPTPGLLPTSCTVTATVQGLYAGVGSGNGQRGYIANNPQQWYNGTVTPTSANASIVPPLPGQPSIIDYTNPQGSVFGSYPYPRVDIALSDSPLPTSTITTSTMAGLTTVSDSFNPAQSWMTSGGTLASITLNSTTQVVAYSTTATFGNPIQIPAFEVNVAIPVNVSSFTTNNSHIAAAVPANVANPGAAVQLTTGQLCAIFSGLVTDWNSTTLIPYLDNTGTLQTTPFDSANVGNGHGIPAAYSSSSLPINLTYRSDGSGTSFIIQNYLHAVCPLLAGPVATDTFKYNAIFGPTFVPGTSFTTLINQIVAARGPGVWNTTTTSGARWIGASGSAGVASTISDTTTAAGNIGYVSADFTRPFTTTVAGVDAPFAAAIQNENLRGQGIYFPNTVSTSTLTFIPPTPAAAGDAWSDSLIQSAAQATWTFADYNVYGITFSNTTTHSGVTLFGQSVLPLTNIAGAYSLVGATFLELYSCYSVTADSHRVANLTTFLSWYYSEGTLVTSVIQNAAFNPLPPNWASTIKAKYLGSLSASLISAAPASGTGTKGCSGVTGGAL